MLKKKMVCLTLSALLALSVCSNAALAYCQNEAAAIAAEGASLLYCHGHGRHGGHHGGRHGGHGHHGSAEACDWLFHAYGDCADVNCTVESHTHRCPVDCVSTEHHHYNVCRYADGALALVQQKA